MKTKLFATIFVAMFLVSTSSFALIDYSSTGWTSSNGFDSVAGVASNVTALPGGNGYSFYCSGFSVCYTIDGPILWINGTVKPPEEGSTLVTITEN